MPGAGPGRTLGATGAHGRMAQLRKALRDEPALVVLAFRGHQQTRREVPPGLVAAAGAEIGDPDSEDGALRKRAQVGILALRGQSSWKASPNISHANAVSH